MGLAAAGLPLGGSASRARVVVVGGGFGGAAAARALRQFAPDLEVVLVEPSAVFRTCPFSNLYLGGLRSFGSLGHHYGYLQRRHGVRVVRSSARAVDPERRQVRLVDGTRLGYDRLILSPGIDMRWDALEGYDQTAAERLPHAWKAGPQTRLLRRQLQAMDDDGLFLMVIPDNPYRCPPGPYERAAMVAHYCRRHKPRAKVLLLDAKDAFSKQALFEQGWREVYGERIEWVGFSGDGEVVRVDANQRIVETAFGNRHQADVINVIPPQQAGYIARQAGVTDRSGWAPVKAGTFESRLVPDVYVIGDAAVAAPMPKSAFCAHSQAGVTAAAVLASLAGREPPEPAWLNTCFSLIDSDYAISISGQYRLRDGEIQEVSGGVSPLQASQEFRRREAEHARDWYAAMSHAIWGA
nr:NAD(P)/FAD-dependent oxidoreductase [Methylonatrum kenyense]